MKPFIFYLLVLSPLSLYAQTDAEKKTTEERQAKIEERMEQMMSKPDAYARISAEGTKRGAMKTADQRADGYRGYLDRKRGN